LWYNIFLSHPNSIGRLISQTRQARIAHLLPSVVFFIYDDSFAASEFRSWICHCLAWSNVDAFFLCVATKEVILEKHDRPFRHWVCPYVVAIV
jgi:hypothetical protein